uniref:S-adenosylmethionine decarboxylase proenzyme n=1 Tax=Strongyloides venezuelensis TaxID=75913 RepID=A0A0K0G4A2_STRVS
MSEKNSDTDFYTSSDEISYSTNSDSSSPLSFNHPTDEDQISQQAHEHFFEGAEKLLEIWFDKDQEGSTSLRNIPYPELVDMLEIAECHILHYQKNEHLDSYVLSESSMFISNNRLILKTCGTTKLLHAIPKILELAKIYGQMTNVVNVYYSRKNFLKPELQTSVHQSFDSEIELLESHFNGGQAFCLGSLKHDRWYLYHYSKPHTQLQIPDHSLEILMTDLPEEVMKTFTKEVSTDGNDATIKSGIDKIVPPGTTIHDELFEPCGYSMNGLVSGTDQYATIHITPEADFSYVSYETNQTFDDLFSQTMKVINCFKPKNFLINIFANEQCIGTRSTQLKFWNQVIPGYRRVNLQYVTLATDTVAYAQFVQV